MNDSLSISNLEVGIETETEEEEFLEAASEIRADLVCNAIGRMVGHVFSWILVGCFTWATPRTPRGQYGQTSPIIQWAASFVVYHLLKDAIARCALLFYTTATGLSLHDFFVAADKNNNGYLCAEEVDNILSSTLGDSPTWYHSLWCHFKGFDRGDSSPLIRIALH